MGFYTRFSIPTNCRPITPEESAELVAEKKALLIDVRETSERVETGMAEPAIPIAMSELNRPDNRELLGHNREKELILYSHSGARSGNVARQLAQEGFRTANMGSFGAWQAAGLPVRNE